MNDLLRFNVICGLHDHAFDTKLQGHPIVCWIKPKKKETILEMSMIKVAMRNILTDLKLKRPQSVSNIRQVYNERYQQKIVNRGLRF